MAERGGVDVAARARLEVPAGHDRRHHYRAQAGSVRKRQRRVLPEGHLVHRHLNTNQHIQI
eukprot:713221-Prorocentrum_minimum.AAC.1